VEDFVACLGLREAVELYLFLEDNEAKLESGPRHLFAELRAYLYDHLSIEDMEKPRKLLERL
jgi:hypothetical protein